MVIDKVWSQISLKSFDKLLILNSLFNMEDTFESGTNNEANYIQMLSDDDL